jgi:hypothetical protein
VEPFSEYPTRFETAMQNFPADTRNANLSVLSSDIGSYFLAANYSALWLPLITESSP